LRETIQTGWATSLVIVSHDRDFAFSVCDRIAILDKDTGTIAYEGGLTEACELPPNANVARFLGMFNIIAGEIEDNNVFKDQAGEFVVPLGPHCVSDRKRAALLLRHRNVYIDPPNTNEGIEIYATITDVAVMGPRAVVKAVTPGGTKIRCECEQKSDLHSLVGKRQRFVAFANDAIIVEN